MEEEFNLENELEDELENKEEEIKPVPHLEELQRVLQFYPIEVKDISLHFSRSGRTKWIVETDKGPMILRQEFIRPERMLYIAGAHWHLQQNGLPIAKLIPTINNGLCLSGEDHAYVLYEHIEGDTLLYYDKEQVMKTMEFIGQFHHASKGYVAPEGSKKRSRIDKWQKLYRWKIQELEGYKKLATNYETDAFSLLFLQHVDQMLLRANESLAELNRPEFTKWTQDVFQSKLFCQQDFTMARMIDVEGKAFMKDLHSVNADLPSRDIRILMNKVMKKLAVWDINLATEMLTNYDTIYPLTEGEYRVLWTDLKFPHLFCAIAHKYYLSQKRSWSDEKYMMHIRNVVSVENSKEEFLLNFDKIYNQIKGGN
ncbi:spore coat-associated protein S [Alkalihalobacillus hemicentroti]|uniref:Spore coat-associated protein S n=1 Tax=Guptibacillus hwajinpoensis TaxID=208199 RepID=A0ABU0K220_9BACL|nr:spore coat-associated protein S [Alkalihalobacillus hemicentroti]